MQKLSPVPLVLLSTGQVVAADNTTHTSSIASFAAVPLVLKPGAGVPATLPGTDMAKPLTAGTGLVDDLINKAKVTTIVESPDGRNHTDPKSVNATNGVGENPTIEFNPDLNRGGIDVDGYNIRPPEIGLGHELSHAKSIAEGTVDNSSSGKIDPDDNTKTLSREELKARKMENLIRKEQGVTPRQIP